MADTESHRHEAMAGYSVLKVGDTTRARMGSSKGLGPVATAAKRTAAVRAAGWNLHH